MRYRGYCSRGNSKSSFSQPFLVGLGPHLLSGLPAQLTRGPVLMVCRWLFSTNLA
jgi:hypothetical protein